MKQPWEWDENDLLMLIEAGVQESIELDYKQCASLDQTDKKRMKSAKMFLRSQIQRGEQSFMAWLKMVMFQSKLMKAMTAHPCLKSGWNR